MHPIAETPTRTGPLAGVRILDMTTVMMGPFATQILADYGANVVKVEPPAGDVMRLAGPHRSAKMGPMYLQANRNKRSIALDIKTEGGRATLLRLLETADVFVSNVRPAALRRLELGPDTMRAVNPRLVHVSIIGYGANGPYAGRPAYDDLIQGMTGFAALIHETGAPRPQYVPVTIADRIVGLNTTHAILAALIDRDRVGDGQAIEVPMFETMAQFVLGDHMGGRAFEPPIGPPGYSRLLAADRRPYRTKDGYLCTLIYTDRHWEAFFRAIGRAEEFAADPRFAGGAARARHYSEIYGVLADILVMRTTDEWVALLQEADIPGVPLYTLDDLIDDPHLAAVGFFHAMDHPSEGPITLTGFPARWSRSHMAITRHPPVIGEQSIDILREAGFAEDRIAQLLSEGAVIDGRLQRAPATPTSSSVLETSSRDPRS